MGTILLQLGDLDNKHDPIRLGRIEDPRNPVIERLTLAENIDIDDYEVAHRRNGRERILTASSPHSFFSGKDKMFGWYVAGGVLYSFNGTASTALSTVGGLRMGYTLVNDEVICSNGSVIGWLSQSAFDRFPTYNEGFMTTMYAGHLLTFYRGVLYVANGSILGFSLPYNVELRDRRYCDIPLPGFIRMLADVEDGLWVATEQGVVFLAGEGPENFTYTQITDAAPPIGAFSAGWEFTAEGVSKAVRWVSEEGFCVGKAGGKYTNLSDNKVALPDGTEGLCIARDFNGLSQYIAVIQNPVGGNFYTPDELTITTIDAT